MIERLSGRIVEKNPEFLSLDVSGITFGVHITLNTYSSLPGPGEKCQVYVDLIYGERGVELFGFASLEERAFFRKVRRIRGIGPKIARNLLSGLTREELVRAVSQSDADVLCRIPGVGAKTARRLIVELKDVIEELELPRVPKEVHQAVSALVNLGFGKREAERAVMEANAENLPLDQLIRRSLQLLTKEKRG